MVVSATGVGVGVGSGGGLVVGGTAEVGPDGEPVAPAVVANGRVGVTAGAHAAQTASTSKHKARSGWVTGSYPMLAA
jgi:hypothetical protein